MLIQVIVRVGLSFMEFQLDLFVCLEKPGESLNRQSPHGNECVRGGPIPLV